MPSVACSSLFAASRATLVPASISVHLQQQIILQRGLSIPRLRQYSGAPADRSRSQVVAAASSTPVVDEDFMTAINEVSHCVLL